MVMLQGYEVQQAAQTEVDDTPLIKAMVQRGLGVSRAPSEATLLSNLYLSWISVKEDAGPEVFEAILNQRDDGKTCLTGKMQATKPVELSSTEHCRKIQQSPSPIKRSASHDTRRRVKVHRSPSPIERSASDDPRWVEAGSRKQAKERTSATSPSQRIFQSLKPRCTRSPEPRRIERRRSADSRSPAGGGKRHWRSADVDVGSRRDDAPPSWGLEAAALDRGSNSAPSAVGDDPVAEAYDRQLTSLIWRKHPESGEMELAEIRSLLPVPQVGDYMGENR